MNRGRDLVGILSTQASTGDNVKNLGKPCLIRKTLNIVKAHNYSDLEGFLTNEFRNCPQFL